MLTPDGAYCRLAQAVISQAIEDARDGDRDAAQFLVAHDGAEIWLHVAGIGVTQKMRHKLRLMALGINRKN